MRKFLYNLIETIHSNLQLPKTPKLPSASIAARLRLGAYSVALRLRTCSAQSPVPRRHDSKKAEKQKCKLVPRSIYCLPENITRAAARSFSSRTHMIPSILHDPTDTTAARIVLQRKYTYGLSTFSILRSLRSREAVATLLFQNRRSHKRTNLSYSSTPPHA